MLDSRFAEMIMSWGYNPKRLPRRVTLLGFLLKYAPRKDTLAWIWISPDASDWYALQRRARKGKTMRGGKRKEPYTGNFN